MHQPGVPDDQAAGTRRHTLRHTVQGAARRERVLVLCPPGLCTEGLVYEAVEVVVEPGHALEPTVRLLVVREVEHPLRVGSEATADHVVLGAVQVLEAPVRQGRAPLLNPRIARRVLPRVDIEMDVVSRGGRFDRSVHGPTVVVGPQVQRILVQHGRESLGNIGVDPIPRELRPPERRRVAPRHAETLGLPVRPRAHVVARDRDVAPLRSRLDVVPDLLARRLALGFAQHVAHHREAVLVVECLHRPCVPCVV
mmetsp:Transcript_67757/g.187184  ORF Transcript_67757/g.187184 Transcript_67757/m.187184 type:complete len:253 (+) Transcript_67757:465-1223(+)